MLCLMEYTHSIYKFCVGAICDCESFVFSNINFLQEIFAMIPFMYFVLYGCMLLQELWYFLYNRYVLVSITIV